MEHDDDDDDDDDDDGDDDGDNDDDNDDDDNNKLNPGEKKSHTSAAYSEPHGHGEQTAKV